MDRPLVRSSTHSNVLNSSTATRVAIASSGLGHIRRGIETWAEDLAVELRARQVPVTLFQGAGPSSDAWRVPLDCRRRFDADTRQIVGFFRKLGGWRYGLGSGYEVEQSTFAWNLWKRVRTNTDVLHVQDPWLACVMDRLNRMGLSRPRVILAHGTEEPPAFLRRLSALQHLAPCYVDDWGPHRPPGQKVYAIPNFVDTERFHPGPAKEERGRWGLPPDALVVLCTAAIKRHHKRIDYLLREFQQFRSAWDGPAVLVVAGGREAETDEVIQLGRALLGDQVRFLEAVPRSDMPSLLRSADLFALASLHEMMPIAVLEALSSGLPVVASDTPTLRWMVGAGGNLADLSVPGAMAEALQAIAGPEQRAKLGADARRHALSLFSPEAVVPQVLSMYADVLGRAE